MLDVQTGQQMQTIRRELIADSRGRLHQAGTVDPGGEAVDVVRRSCEQSLYSFITMILGRDYLSDVLHRPICNWLAKSPPYRKLLLLPRRHAKTSIVSHGLPLHINIQPIGGPYIPWKAGSEIRLLLAGETELNASNNLGVIKHVHENNELFRGLWPQLVWPNPARDSGKWNATAAICPRQENYPDPTFRAIGVGGAITGARHDIHIKDDIISEEASNSEVVMHAARRWHMNTRALFDDPDKSLEFLVGTRWAVSDVYSDIMINDPSVSTVIRSIVENGRTIYPEAFSMDTVERLRSEFGIMFHLLYMNSVSNPDLVDFTDEMLRFFGVTDGEVEYADDIRDGPIDQASASATVPFFEIMRGERLTAEVQEQLGSVRDEYIRVRAG